MKKLKIQKKKEAKTKQKTKKQQQIILRIMEKLFLSY